MLQQRILRSFQAASRNAHPIRSTRSPSTPFVSSRFSRPATSSFPPTRRQYSQEAEAKREEQPNTEQQTAQEPAKEDAAQLELETKKREVIDLTVHLTCLTYDPRLKRQHCSLLCVGPTKAQRRRIPQPPRTNETRSGRSTRVLPPAVREGYPRYRRQPRPRARDCAEREVDQRQSGFDESALGLEDDRDCAHEHAKEAWSRAV